MVIPISLKENKKMHITHFIFYKKISHKETEKMKVLEGDYMEWININEARKIGRYFKRILKGFEEFIQGK